jgi:hypothetical protein
MQLPDILITLSSLAALLLPGLFKRDGLADWKNGLIAGFIVALFSALSVWAGGQFTGNLVADWALFAAAYSALLAGPFAPLDSWLQSALNLPFLKPAPANSQTVRVPSALVMPGSSPIPPRASAGQQEPPAGA